jgi:transcriptional regulator with PAS, ATPase and Fis domain
MNKPSVLLIQSISSPLAPVESLLKQRGFEIRLSRSWEEAELCFSALPGGQIDQIYVDMTLCQGGGWEKFMYRTRIAPSGATVVFFQPQFLQSLCTLLGSEPPLNSAEREAGEPSIVGENGRFREVLDLASRYAQHDITVLITGETGTGKEVLAQYIHSQSLRKDRSLVACSLVSIPETLLESELFGYVKGAFTGANKDKMGLIEMAEGGTLFLDEIGDLPLTLQAKLLRFLESREFYKVGASSPKTADVRIIAATNRDLETAILCDGFRKDLYYRVNSARIMVPPLRERREDVLPLVEHFVRRASLQARGPMKKISSSVQALFLDYSWPGNVREVKSAIESSVMVSDTEYITLMDLPMHLQQYAAGHRQDIGATAIKSIDEAEKSLVEDAVRQANGNKARAAALLGISVRTLYRKLEKLSPTPFGQGEFGRVAG